LEEEFPELSPEQEVIINEACVQVPPSEVLVSTSHAQITSRDIQRLKGLTWLNDEIINFYMGLICDRSERNTSPLRCYAFSTFFYPKLVKDGYNATKLRSCKVDLFSYQLVLVPVHLGDHWTLAVIDFTCQEIRYYNSLNGNNIDCLEMLR
jgi:sentrin-specific protease 1